MITTIDLKEIPKHKYAGYGERLKDVDDFVESGANAAEIILKPGDIARDLQCSYINAIKRRKYRDLCRAVMRGNRLFLVKVEGKRV